MRFLILSGTVGNVSCTRTMLRYLDDLLKKDGHETYFWDLGENPLPIAVPEYYDRPNENPDKRVRDFVDEFNKADGFLFGSPLYHGSYSGVLKNALDNLPPDGLKFKPVALVSHSSNARSCVTPCTDLRPIVRSLSGYSTQSQIGTTDDDFIKKDGQIVLHSKKIISRGEKLVEELIELSKALKDMAAIPG